MVNALELKAPCNWSMLHSLAESYCDLSMSVKVLTKVLTQMIRSWNINVLGVCLSTAGSWRQETRQRSPDLSVPNHFLQPIWGNTQAFPGELKDVFSPACPCFAPGAPPSRLCLEHLTQEGPRRHPSQMPKLPHLAPFNAEAMALF